MPIIINGKVFGNVYGNLRIVNGQVISGDSFDDITSKNFDEIKKEPASGINRIMIDSDVDVKVSACNTNEVTAHFQGSAITNNTYKLCMKRFDKEIHISLKSEGSSMCIINGGGLVLDVQIPERDFQRLTIESQNGNIDITSFIKASTITINSKNGNINIDAKFQTLYIDCKNGNIDVTSEAHGDIDLDVVSQNGNIDVSIDNIGTSKVFVDSKNGNCRNTPRLRGIFTASGNITSKNGNVKFR